MELPMNLQLPGIDVESYRKKDKEPLQKTLDSINDNKQSEMTKVAKEMESLFIYELIKVMRESSDTMSSDTEGLGKDTYTNLFDIEVSRAIAERGIGIREAILTSLGKSQSGHNVLNDK